MDTTLAVLLFLRGVAASAGQLLVDTTLEMRLRGTVAVTARPVSELAPPTRGLPILRWQQGLGRLGWCRLQYWPWPLARYHLRQYLVQQLSCVVGRPWLLRRPVPPVRLAPTLVNPPQGYGLYPVHEPVDCRGRDIDGLGTQQFP